MLMIASCSKKHRVRVSEQQSFTMPPAAMTQRRWLRCMGSMLISISACQFILFPIELFVIFASRLFVIYRFFSCIRFLINAKHATQRWPGEFPIIVLQIDGCINWRCVVCTAFVTNGNQHGKQYLVHCSHKIIVHNKPNKQIKLIIYFFIRFQGYFPTSFRI